MFKKRFLVLTATAMVAALGCHSGSESPTDLASLIGVPLETGPSGEAPVKIELQSEAIAEDGSIGLRYTCDGRNISPPLSWSGVPEGTAALVLLIDDPDPPQGTFSHWVVLNLPPDLDRLEADIPYGDQITSLEGKEGIQASQGVNGFHNLGYDGPCPPEGVLHRYVIHLYAIDEPLELTGPATRERVLEAIQGHVLGKGRLTGSFIRSQAG